LRGLLEGIVKILVLGELPLVLVTVVLYESEQPDVTENEGIK